MIMKNRIFTFVGIGITLLVISVSGNVFAGGENVTNIPDPVTDVSTSVANGKETAVFAGGCFWGMEAIFENTKGVSEVVSGFSGGSKETAFYEQVSRGETEHAEAIKITYDPTQISYGELLKIYFGVAHDPTQLNRQGPDYGKQYRSSIFFINNEQKKVAEAYMEQLNKKQIFKNPIVTELVPLDSFYVAEEYHQNFVVRNPNHPYVVVHDMPKLEQFQKQFPELYKP